MKRLTMLFLSLILMLLLIPHTNAAASDEAFVKKASMRYGTAVKKIAFHLTGNGKLTDYFYDSYSLSGALYIPINDLFANHVDSLSWDNTRKVATVKNQSKELLLNLSRQPINAGENQIILPSEWVKSINGRVAINLYVLTYIFDRYFDQDGVTDNPERQAWETKLSFLNIDWTDALASVKDGHMHLYLVYKDQFKKS